MLKNPGRNEDRKGGLGRALRKGGIQEEERKVSKGPVSKAHHSSGAGEHFHVTGV